MEDTNKCMACECPCDEHKEHTHGQAEEKCKACACPCDEHKEHTHAKEDKCMACECPCDEHKEHSHDCSKCGHAHGEDGKCDCNCA